MERSHSRTNILFLKGIALSDINSIEQMLENRLIEEMSVRKDAVIPKTFINMEIGFQNESEDNMAIDNGVVSQTTSPKKKNTVLVETSTQQVSLNNETLNAPHDIFAGIETWDKKTDLCCWSCSLHFNTIPVPAPIYISKMATDIIEIVIEGNFCSFSCAQRYINIIYLKDGSYINKSNMLRTLFKYFTGQTVHYIDEAMSPTKMKKYMGNNGLREDEYVSKKTAISITTKNPAATFTVLK